MVKRKTRHQIQGRTGPYYSLGVVKGLVKNGDVRILNKPRKSADKDFGWDSADILDALMKLQLKHFYKPELSNFEPHFPIDVYKARGLKGENVYTHFYIDNETNLLVVQSFKEI